MKKLILAVIILMMGSNIYASQLRYEDDPNWKGTFWLKHTIIVSRSPQEIIWIWPDGHTYIGNEIKIGKDVAIDYDDTPRKISMPQLTVSLDMYFAEFTDVLQKIGVNKIKIAALKRNELQETLNQAIDEARVEGHKKKPKIKITNVKATQKRVEF